MTLPDDTKDNVNDTTEDVKTETDVTPPRGELFDSSKHVTIAGLNARVDRARKKERQDVLDALGLTSLDGVDSLQSEHANALKAIQTERDTLASRVQELEQADAVRVRNQRLTDSFVKEGVESADVAKLIALAGVDGIDFNEVFTENGDVDGEKFTETFNLLKKNNGRYFDRDTAQTTGRSTSSKQGRAPNVSGNVTDEVKKAYHKGKWRL